MKNHDWRWMLRKERDEHMKAQQAQRSDLSRASTLISESQVPVGHVARPGRSGMPLTH